MNLMNLITLPDKDFIADLALSIFQKVTLVTFIDALDVQRSKITTSTMRSEAALALSAITYLGLRTSLLD